MNRSPADNPGGIPFKLATESCHAGLDVDDEASIFEEHFICKSLSAWYCANSRTDGCTVYIQDERKFMFVNVLIGSHVKARFKLRNSSKVHSYYTIQYDIILLRKLPGRSLTRIKQ